MTLSFQFFLERGQGGKVVALEFPDPTFGDLVDGNGIDVVELFPPSPLPGYETRLPENGEMLGDRLARHGEPRAQLAQRLAVLPVQPVKQLPPARVGQGVKQGVVIHARNMEPFGSLT